MNNTIDEFRQVMAAALGEAPDVIHDDGKIHRFSPSGRSSDKAGWYVLHSDGVPAGTFGNWRDDFKQDWCAKSGEAMTPAERDAYRQRVKAMQAQRDADLLATQQQASDTAMRRFNDATPCTQHGYLAAKDVKGYGVRVEADGFLIVPMRDTAGKLWNIERINPADSKDKRGLYGGRRDGLYHAIGGKPVGCLIVCEGYATGASIHEATGDAVAVAFNAGNVPKVVAALHSKYPELQLIVAADDDYLTEGNPGMTKAMNAALAVGGFVAVPEFGPDRPERATDFNDLHQTAGLEAVRRCIEGATRPASDAPTSGNDWPEPTPLPNALPPVQAFSFNLLPDALRPWVADIAERMQCPPDFLAVGAMVAASALVGARVQVQPKARDDWRVTPNLWGVVVGRPGAMKSPALNEVLKPLKRIEAKKREAYDAKREEWEISQRLGKLQEAASEASAKKAVKDGNIDRARALLKAPDLDPEPVAARLIVNDPSVPALGEVMRANPWGVLLERDEIYGLLKGMDGEGKEPDRAFYLTAYDGDKSYTVDRIGRGLNLHIPRLCLAMIGGIQPGRLSEYVRGAVAGGSADDGLIQRFQLTVWPDASPEWKNVDEWPDTPARQAANEVFDRLELLPTPDDEAPAWRFDAAAQAVFNDWRTELELRLRSDTLHPALESHLSKNKKTVPALALLFALIDNPNAGQIGEPELTRALMWADYLETHAMRVYAAGVNPEAEGAALLLKRIKAGALADKDGVIADTFTTRDVYRKGWAGMTTPDAVRKAAEYLCEFDWLRREVVAAGAAGGRSSEQYWLNPSLLAGGAA